MEGKTPPFQVAKLSLKDFLNHKNMEGLVGKTFAFVSISDSLADAKKRMEALKNCQDVFVTDDGSEDKPVLGWLTNIEITKHSKA
jgi:hypothetical protein